MWDKARRILSVSYTHLDVYKRQGKNVPKAILAAVIILAIIVGMVLFVVYLQGGERRIPVQYSKKIQGRKQVGGQSTYIPLKVNTGGVIPVIFAQSLLQTPVIIASLLGKGNGTGIGSKILRGMSPVSYTHLSIKVCTYFKSC